MSRNPNAPPTPCHPQLNTILNNNKWIIKKSPPDGHCLMHSIVSSFNSQLPHLKSPTLTSLKADLRNHIHQHFTEYFIYGFNEHRIKLQLKKYIVDKDFDSDLVDIAPLIFARLLRVRVEILDTDRNGTATSHSFDPPTPTPDCIRLHRRGMHYNGIILSAPPACPPSPDPTPVTKPPTLPLANPPPPITTTTSPNVRLSQASPELYAEIFDPPSPSKAPADLGIDLRPKHTPGKSPTSPAPSPSPPHSPSHAPSNQLCTTALIPPPTNRASEHPPPQYSTTSTLTTVKPVWANLSTPSTTATNPTHTHSTITQPPTPTTMTAPAVMETHAHSTIPKLPSPSSTLAPTVSKSPALPKYSSCTLRALRYSAVHHVSKPLRRTLISMGIWGQHHGCPVDYYTVPSDYTTPKSIPVHVSTTRLKSVQREVNHQNLISIVPSAVSDPVSHYPVPCPDTMSATNTIPISINAFARPPGPASSHHAKQAPSLTKIKMSAPHPLLPHPNQAPEMLPLKRSRPW